MGVPQQTYDFLEDGHRLEVWLNEESQFKRRATMGLEEPRTAIFVAEREFLSIGCFCGVARALQALGLKKLAYPFDWTRTPADGVIHVLDTGFEDFLTYTHVQHPTHLKQPVYTASRWGGSFWHHDPEAPSTALDFTRRAERFLGIRDVPQDKARVFVRAVNSTRELDSILHLRDALVRAFPNTPDVRMLVLIDLQKTKGPMILNDGSSASLLFYGIHEDIFAKDGVQSSWTMQKHAEAYAEAIAFAAAFWAGSDGTADQVRLVADLKTLAADCHQWDGGATTGELFLPRPIKGQTIRIQSSPVAATILLPCPIPVASTYSAVPLQNGASQDERKAPLAASERRVEELQEEIQRLREVLRSLSPQKDQVLPAPIVLKEALQARYEQEAKPNRTLVRA